MIGREPEFVVFVEVNPQPRTNGQAVQFKGADSREEAEIAKAEAAEIFGEVKRSWVLPTLAAKAAILLFGHSDEELIEELNQMTQMQ